MSAIDPWAEIARLQKELDFAVAYHDECGKIIEAALDTDARKYNEGGSLFQHYASDIRRIRRERDICQRKALSRDRDAERDRQRQTLDLPLACPHCKKLIGYDYEDNAAPDSPSENIAFDRHGKRLYPKD